MSKHRPICLSTEERTELAEKLEEKGLSLREHNRIRILPLSDRSTGHQRTLQEATAAICSAGTVKLFPNKLRQSDINDLAAERFFI